MEAFSYHGFIFLLAFIDRWKIYIIDSFFHAVKIAIEVKFLCVSTSKKRHSPRASLFLTVFFVCERRN